METNIIKEWKPSGVNIYEQLYIDSMLDDYIVLNIIARGQVVKIF